MRKVSERRRRLWFREGRAFMSRPSAMTRRQTALLSWRTTWTRRPLPMCSASMTPPGRRTQDYNPRRTMKWVGFSHASSPAPSCAAAEPWSEHGRRDFKGTLSLSICTIRRSHQTQRFHVAVSSMKGRLVYLSQIDEIDCGAQLIFIEFEVFTAADNNTALVRIDLDSEGRYQRWDFVQRSF